MAQTVIKAMARVTHCSVAYEESDASRSVVIRTLMSGSRIRGMRVAGQQIDEETSGPHKHPAVFCGKPVISLPVSMVRSFASIPCLASLTRPNKQFVGISIGIT